MAIVTHANRRVVGVKLHLKDTNGQIDTSVCPFVSLSVMAVRGVHPVEGNERRCFIEI